MNTVLVNVVYEADSIGIKLKLRCDFPYLVAQIHWWLWLW